MCVIIVCPPGRTPDYDDLWLSAECNDDGHGWAIQTRNGLEMFKTLDKKEAIGSFLQARRHWSNNWAMWHSRFATQGSVNTDNVQPFVVPNNGWAMAHNGILPLSDGPFDDRDRSDSRILAEDYLSGATWHMMKKERERFDSYITPSKIVILSPTSYEGIQIFGERRGSWENDGCWWSSRPYFIRSWPTTTYATAKTPNDLDDEEEEAWWQAQEEAAELAMAKDDETEWGTDDPDLMDDVAYNEWLRKNADMLSEVDR